MLFHPADPARAEEERQRYYEQFVLLPGGRPTRALAIDGHHRLFVSYLMGSSNLPCELAWYPEIAGAKAELKLCPNLAQAGWDSIYDISESLCEAS